VFPGKYQPELAQVFRQHGTLDFGVGYRWRPNESNLLLAVKKGAPVEPQRAEVPKAEPPKEEAPKESTKSR
jgi:hypothetical protein